MAVPFVELAGSPVEYYTRTGFGAQRVFLVAWEDREAFAAAMLGTAPVHGSESPAHYPGKDSVLPVRLRIEALDPCCPEAQQFTGLSRGLNRYTDGLARVVVHYETIVARDRPDGPENPPGTRLTYRMGHTLRNERLLARAWRWADQPDLPLPDDLELLHTIPITEHQLVWQQVVAPPWAAISQLQGKVNAGAFLGCAPGTLLFVGATANKWFRAGLDQGDSDFCWKIEYVFHEKAIKQAGRVLGWNHAYRDDPPGWAEITDGTHPLYEPADFAPLFRFQLGL